MSTLNYIPNGAMADDSFVLPAVLFPLNDSNFRFADSGPFMNLVKLAESGLDPYFNSPSAQSVIYVALSVLALVLCVPCLAFYIKHRNLPALCIIAWLLYLNLVGVVNALIWPTDNVSTWYLGYGWCDVTRKLTTGSQLGLIGSLCALFRGLANALNTDRARLIASKAHIIRERIVECLFCFGTPIYLMVIEYVVQSNRYSIYAVSGCAPSYSGSWVSLILMDIWPAVFCFVAGYFAVLVTLRVWRYRSQFASILASTGSGMSNKRFIRLYILSDILLLLVLPVQIFVLISNIPTNIGTYSWEEVHGPDNWNYITLIPMDGVVVYDRWVRCAAGILVFLILGLGGEATEFYRKCLVALGFGSIFKSLNNPRSRRGGSSRRLFSSSLASSIGSKYHQFANKFRHSSSTGSTGSGSHALNTITSDIEKGNAANDYANDTTGPNKPIRRRTSSITIVSLLGPAQTSLTAPNDNDTIHSSSTIRPATPIRPSSPLRSPNPRTAIAPSPISIHPSLSSLRGPRLSADERIYSALETSFGLDGAADDPDPDDADAKPAPDADAGLQRGTHADANTHSTSVAHSTAVAGAKQPGSKRERARALLPRLKILRGVGSKGGSPKSVSPKTPGSAQEAIARAMREVEFEEAVMAHF